MIRTIAFFVVIASLLVATDAQAQFFRKREARQMMATMAPAPASTTIAHSYSYYSRSNLPARTYVGYGSNDFPFHGAPYGHPYDPYTWNAMSGSYVAEMSRYYSPPVK